MQEIHLTRQSSNQLLKKILKNNGVGIRRVIIASYAITDDWMRLLQKMRISYEIEKIIIVLDREVMIRHREKLNQLIFSADEVYLTDSHAKMYYAEGKTPTVVVTSANATRNFRNESSFLTDDPELVAQMLQDINTIINESYRII